MKCLLLLSMVVLIPVFHADGQRAAFIIGIANYQHMDALPNCEHNADSIKEALHRIGYDTFEIKNASNAQVRTQLDAWLPLMQKYQDVVIYFSGHGFMMASTNEFMALNDFDKTYNHVEDRTMHKFFLLQKLATLTTAPASFPENKIIIIDACRDFPDVKEIKRYIGQLTLVEPYLQQYKVWYSVLAGRETFADGPTNSYATTALLAQLRNNPYLEQQTFFNMVNGRIVDFKTNNIAFRDDGAPFDWAFSPPKKEGPGFVAPFVPNTQICFGCKPNHVGELLEMIGADQNSLLSQSPKDSVKQLKIGRDTLEAVAVPYSRSDVGVKMDFELKKFDISPSLVDTAKSFLVYEFSRQKLQACQVYLKYKDPSLHERLAKALGLDLDRFPGFCYLSSLPELEAGLSDTRIDSFPVLFGRVVKYGYTILEIGPAEELLEDSRGISKFTGVFTVLHTPAWTDYR